MKNNVGIRVSSFVALMVSMALSAFAQNQPGKPWQVNVMSYNVQHCAGVEMDINYVLVSRWTSTTIERRISSGGSSPMW